MKKIIIIKAVSILLYCLLFINASSQVINADRGWNFNTMDRYLEFAEKKNFDDDVLLQLRKSKTILFLNYNEEEREMLDYFYKSALTQSWDLSEIEIDHINNLSKYKDLPGFSLLLIEGKYVHGSKDMANTARLYLTLTLNMTNGKDTKVKPIVLGRIDLFPSHQFSSVKTGGMFDFKDRDDEVNFAVYEGLKNNWMLNFTPVSLMAHLGVISSNIKKKIRPDHKDDIRDENLNAILARDTLYIPKSILKGYKIAGLNSTEEFDLDEEVLKEYKYNYKICSDKELYFNFIVEKRSRLLFEYVKLGSSKYIYIIDTKLKKYILKEVGSAMKTPVLNEKDFKKICK